MDHIHSNTIEDLRIPGRHLSLKERGMIYALHCQGLSLRDIAAAVGCVHTPVFYELRWIRTCAGVEAPLSQG